MRRLIAVAIVLALACLEHPQAVSAERDVNSANTWFDLCAADQNGLCTGYLKAMMDMNYALMSIDRAMWCPPDGVTVGQMNLIVMKGLRERPADLHRPFVGLVMQILNDTFPCAVGGGQVRR